MTADGRIATLVGYVSASPNTARRARKPGAMRPVDDLGFDLDRVPKSVVPVGQPSAAQPVVIARAPVAEPQVVAETVIAEPVVVAETSVPQVISSNADSVSAQEAAVEPAAEAPDPQPALTVPQLAPKAAPPVRKLAKDLGVDLRTVSPGRADGVISRAEVEAAAGAAGAVVAPSTGSYDTRASDEQAGGTTSSSSTAPAARPRETRIPIKGIRKMTAQAMVASAFTAPHVTEFLTVDVTPMMELRDKVRRRPEFADVKVSPLAFAAFAVCRASRRTPEINSVWDGDSGEIVVKNYVNVGIAAATPRGLIVPVINDADRLDLRGIAMALAGLIDKARAGKTSPAEMSGGTFTITNVGVFGVDTGTPIINPGESAILALGSIKDAPWVVDGQLAVRKVCQLSLSFDHRVIDGQQGSQFLADVGALLADPGLSLVF